MPDFAHFYRKGEDITDREAWTTAWADGGLISTATDELAFISALASGRFFERPDTLRMMHNWRKLEQRSMPFAYGYGTMKLDLPRIYTLGARLPEMWGHFGSTGRGLLHCEELDYAVVAATNQTQSMPQLVRFLIGVRQTMNKLA